MRFGKHNRIGSDWLSRVFASGGALVLGIALTVSLFLVLPILENIGRPDDKPDLQLTTVDAVEPPPSPPNSGGGET